MIESGGESDSALELESGPKDDPVVILSEPESPILVTREPAYGHVRARGNSAVGSATAITRDARPRRYTNETRLSETPGEFRQI